VEVFDWGNAVVSRKGICSLDQGVSYKALYQMRRKASNTNNIHTVNKIYIFSPF